MLDQINSFGGRLPFVCAIDGYEGALGLMSIEDYPDSLVGAEQQFLENKNTPAAKAFVSGRRCIRALQKHMGLGEFEVVPGDYGPIWPNDLVGSISHTRKTVAATILKNVTSVGIDIEKQARLKGKVVGRIATEKEQLSCSNLAEFDWTVIFSAKEAVFKALNPLAKSYIGFREVELLLDFKSQSFSVSYSGNTIDKSLFERSKGRWSGFADHIITMVTVD